MGVLYPAGLWGGTKRYSPGGSGTPSIWQIDRAVFRFTWL